jgi:UDP-3-O-[3-hydroxymyristoyl] glucosamine N-acyltransferase
VNKALTLGELAAQVGAELHGDAACRIDCVAPLDRARPGAIAFLNNPRFRRHLADTAASAVILRQEDLVDCSVPALVSANPHLTYARVAALLYPLPPMRRGVHSGAVVEADSQVAASAWIGPHSVVESGAVIDEDVFIGPGCVIGARARIGAGSRLEARVTVCHDVRIGKRALIYPGAVIGSDGFGLAGDAGTWVRVPQLGTVSIGDDVEIGANTTIDRGALDDTVIEDGVKLDNQIQVAHNVRIGAHTAIAGCVGIAGSATIGKRCTVGGGVGIAGHLEIADDVHLTGMTFVTKSITEPGLYSSGMPAETNKQWHRSIARYRKLDEMAARIKALEEGSKVSKT